MKKYIVVQTLYDKFIATDTIIYQSDNYEKALKKSKRHNAELYERL